MVSGSSARAKNEKRKPVSASKPLAVVLMSGGLDSCVAAAVARQSFELACFHANYGQRTLRRELAAFRAQAAFFRAARVLEADLLYLGAMGGSSLTDVSRPVPAGEAEPPGIPSTYVPFRNSNLLAAAVAWAEVLGAEAVFIGANVLDNPGYPDCRPEYFEAFDRLIELGTRPETHIHIHTPLIQHGQGRHHPPGPGTGGAPGTQLVLLPGRRTGLRAVLLLPFAPQRLRGRGPVRSHSLSKIVFGFRYKDAVHQGEQPFYTENEKRKTKTIELPCNPANRN